LLPGVQDKRFDVAVDGTADTRARQKVVKFVDYSNIGEVILARTAKAALSRRSIERLACRVAGAADAEDCCFRMQAGGCCEMVIGCYGFPSSW
jgi:ABC-type amino acid transport substrate-binding protein